MSKSILVTGGAGFIGSNFVPYFCKKYPDYQIINLDKLTYAGNLDNLQECHDMSNYTFVQGDICDVSMLEKLFAQYDIRGVIHFAAESHVDNSITGPRPFIETNILGTFNLLETARKYWMTAPNQYKAGYENCRFHHISTDEVYGTLGDTGLFEETTAYAPNSPYSAKQHPEKLIPKIISNCLAEKAIPIYGDGKNIRDWLYVLDHCKAIDLIYHTGKAGETYNVGGRNERNNLEIVHKICAILDEKRPRKSGKYADLITFVKDRAGHDKRYAIDATKLETELGWKAEETFETGIVKTVEWYLR